MSSISIAVVGALSAVVGSLGPLIVSLYMAKQEHKFLIKKDSDSRAFAAREARYQDTHRAISEFYSTICRERDGIKDFEDKHGGAVSPGDVFEEHAFDDVERSYSGLLLLSSDELANAATTLKGSVIERFFSDDHEDRLGADLAKFLDVARLELRRDAH